MRYLATGLGLLLGLSGPLLAAAAGPTVEQRLQRLERRVERVTDLTLTLDAVREENRRLRGQIENLHHQIEQLKRKQRDIYLDIDQRISALQQGAAAATPAGAAPLPAPAPAPVTEATGAAVPAAPAAGSGAAAQTSDAVVADPKQMEADYQAARALLSPQVRRYDEAAKAFSAFLKKYPQSPLAANAQYWLAGAYYVSQKNDLALAAFSKLVSDYPASSKVPEALYKIGRIHAARGDKVKAVQFLTRVVKTYPSSPAAGLAREQLNKLHKDH